MCMCMSMSMCMSMVPAQVLITPFGTLDALERIKNYTAKHNIDDRARVQAAIDHYEPQVMATCMCMPMATCMCM